MFRCLCEIGLDRRVTMRPTSLRQVAAVAGVSPDEVKPIAEVFRHPGRSFLMPPVETPLTEDTFLDISHESLIRQWKTLRDWVEDEAESARMYRRILDAAKRWAQGKAALWGTPDLEVAEKWKRDQRPSPVWAERYRSERA